MATTVTTLNGALSATASRLTLTAYTAPSGRAKPLLRIDEEIFLITDTASSPTLGVVRGYMGSSAVAHETQAGAEYGSPNDFPVTSHGPTQQSPSLTNPYVLYNAQEITSTGSTSADAAIVKVPSPAFLNITGATSSGVNLGVPSVGESYVLNNKTTGTIKIYCAGGSINGTTGTTSFDITATGNHAAQAFCSTAGAWQIVYAT
jgi:hypothetical protein